MLLEVAEEGHLGSINKQLPAFVADFVRKTVRALELILLWIPGRKR
jgi:hypothetical protein